MELIIGKQLINFAYSIVLGLIFGAFYDIIRLIQLSCGIVSFLGNDRGMSRKPAAFAIFALLDTLFMLMCTAAFSVFLYAVNKGGFRIYLLCGIAAGMTVYHYTVGRIVVFAAEKSVRAIRLAVKTVIVKPICLIVLLAWRLIRFIVRCTVGRLVKLILTAFGMMRTERVMRRIKRDIRFDVYTGAVMNRKGSAQSEKSI